jgi:hypothetical protein
VNGLRERDLVGLPDEPVCARRALEDARLDEALDHLLDEERIPSGPLPDPAAKRSERPIGTQQVIEQLVARLRAQGAQGNLPVGAPLHPLRAVLGTEVHQKQGPAPLDVLDGARQEGVGRRVDPVQVLDQDHARLALAPRPDDAAHHGEEASLPLVRGQLRRGALRIRDAGEVEEQRKLRLDLGRQQHDRARDLVAGGLGAVAVADLEGLAQELKDGEEGDRLSVGDALGLAHGNAARPAALGELVAQPGLAGPGLGHEPDHLALARRRALERGFQRPHLVRSADEPAEAARAGEIEARAERAHALQLVHVDRALDALHARRPDRAELEVAGGEPRGVLGQVCASRLRERLHPRREIHGRTLGGVVHAQVVSDPADDDLAGVEPHPYREVETPLQSQLVRVAPQRVPQPDRRVARALRVVLVRDRCAEQRHDPIAGVLVDRPVEAVHAVGQDLEEAVEDAVPLLRIDLLRELDRALHVREQHRHLLALAFERAARGQDLVGQVRGGVVARGAFGLPRLGGSRRHTGGRGECAPVPHGHPLDLHQLLDQLVEGVVAEVELALESAEGDAPVAFEKRSSLLDGLQKAHRCRPLRIPDPILYPASPCKRRGGGGRSAAEPSEARQAGAAGRYPARRVRP